MVEVKAVATRNEIYNLRDDATLNENLSYGISEACRAVLVEVTPSQPRLDWAVAGIQNPTKYCSEIMWFFLMEHKDKTVAAITALDDVAVLVTVNLYIDLVVK